MEEKPWSRSFFVYAPSERIRIGIFRSTLYNTPRDIMSYKQAGVSCGRIICKFTYIKVTYYA